MIYNKKLGISDEMINNEEDMDVVMGWRREIEAEIVEFNLRTANYPELSRNQKKARAILYSLRLLCKSRMSLYDLQLKEEGKWKSPREVKSDRYLASVFMEVAKNSGCVNKASTMKGSLTCPSGMVRRLRLEVSPAHALVT